MVRRRTAIVLFVMALVGCSHADEEADRATTASATTATASTAAVETGEVTVVEAPETLRGAYAIGNRVFGVAKGGPKTLAAEVNSTLIGTLAPGAVPHPDRPLLAYNSFRRKRPVVRLYDLGRGRDIVLAEGAYSPAWRHDGAIAYFKGLRPQVGPDVKTYRGHVVVRESPTASGARWTSRPGRYVVAAWATDRILAYHIRPNAFPDLVVIDGPSRSRTLAEASALVALSPDGSRAFVARYGASRPAVRIVNVADATEVASLEVGADAAASPEEALPWVAESGSWTGDVVIAPTLYGVAVFRVRPQEIVLEQVLRFDPDVFPLGVAEPRADETGQRIIASAQLQPRPRQAVPPATVLECDRTTRECVQGPLASSVPGPRIVYDPSRP